MPHTGLLQTFTAFWDGSMMQLTGIWCSKMWFKRQSSAMSVCAQRVFYILRVYVLLPDQDGTQRAPLCLLYCVHRACSTIKSAHPRLKLWDTAMWHHTPSELKVRTNAAWMWSTYHLPICGSHLTIIDKREESCSNPLCISVYYELISILVSRKADHKMS